jgi:hypothetical protein
MFLAIKTPTMFERQKKSSGDESVINSTEHERMIVKSRVKDDKFLLTLTRCKARSEFMTKSLFEGGKGGFINKVLSDLLTVLNIPGPRSV